MSASALDVTHVEKYQCSSIVLSIVDKIAPSAFAPRRQVYGNLLSRTVHDYYLTSSMRWQPSVEKRSAIEE